MEILSASRRLKRIYIYIHTRLSLNPARPTAQMHRPLPPLGETPPRCACVYGASLSARSKLNAIPPRDPRLRGATSATKWLDIVAPREWYVVLECGSIDDTIRIKYACVKFVQGKGETSAISAIRSRTRYKGMERRMQWKSSRSAWNQLRERMARSLYSFAFSRRGTKRAWITRHRKTRTSLPRAIPLCKFQLPAIWRPSNRGPGQIFTRRRYLYEPLNARSTHDIVFSRMKVTFFFFFF